jgi:hypothetical protein
VTQDDVRTIIAGITADNNKANAARDPELLAGCEDQASFEADDASLRVGKRLDPSGKDPIPARSAATRRPANC